MSIPPAPVVPQDYICSFRYGNELEPSQCPPKMVNLNTNASSHLLDPTFITRAALSGSECIDIDGELGMPLNMIHISGAFIGEDSEVRTCEKPPAIHPHDRHLLRTPAQLRTHHAGTVGTSRLTRAKYVSSEISHSAPRGRPQPSVRSVRLATTGRKKTPAIKIDDQDPVRTLAAVLKGFDVANPETAPPLSYFFEQDLVSEAAEHSWNNPTHPTKPHLSVVDMCPLLPDSAAQSDTGGFLVFKFSTSPVAASKVRDTRVDVGLLRPHSTPSPSSSLRKNAPSFDYYLPSTKGTATRIKRKLNACNGEDPHPQEVFPYEYIRAYETKSHIRFDPAVIEQVAMIFKEGGNDKQKTAYYYPVIGKYVLHPRRSRIFPSGMPLQPEQYIQEQQKMAEGVEAPDILNVRVRDLNSQEKERRNGLAF